MKQKVKNRFFVPIISGLRMTKIMTSPRPSPVGEGVNLPLPKRRGRKRSSEASSDATKDRTKHLIARDKNKSYL
jgi:hypothetical protein